LFEKIISLENLFVAWREFSRGKNERSDVQSFAFTLEDNIVDLHECLTNETYRHGGYEKFFVNDPKLREIHKASVRDRLLHHAVVRVIQPLFERSFIYDSWSCREGKGTHGAVDRFQDIAWKLSRNNTNTVWVLKLDIKKYFASVDQRVLLALLARRVHDERVMALLHEVVLSFPKGFPLGNLTSQLFANVYLHELDYFIRHHLRASGYVRYCDDFVLIDKNRGVLLEHLKFVKEFVFTRLSLTLHPTKVSLSTYSGGIDFLGYVCFPYYRILRTKTKRRMLKNITSENFSSYFGMLGHCSSDGLRYLATKAVSGVDDRLIYDIQRGIIG